MARFITSFPFLGAMGQVTAYRRRGSDDIIVRTRSGVDPKRVKTGPEFARSRENSAEFGARGKMAGLIYRKLNLLKPVFDQNVQSLLCKHLMGVQQADKFSPRGQKGLVLRNGAPALEGLNLSKQKAFENMVMGAIQYQLDAEKGAARLVLPRLLNGQNFFMNSKELYFQWRVVLTIVPDLHYSGEGYEFSVESDQDISCEWRGNWNGREGSPEEEVALKLNELPLSGGYSFLLAIGLVTGNQNNEEAVPVNYAGVGKILKIM